MEPPAGRAWLILAAIGSFLVALAHLIAIMMGASAYRYMGAPELAQLLERGSHLPPLLTGILVIVFAIWGLYALSGIRAMPRLPWLSPGLAVIGTLYALRGIAVLPELYKCLAGEPYPFRMLLFSAISLAIGLLYLWGWRCFRTGKTP